MPLSSRKFDLLPTRAISPAALERGACCVHSLLFNMTLHHSSGQGTTLVCTSSKFCSQRRCRATSQSRGILSHSSPVHTPPLQGIRTTEPSKEDAY